MNLSKLDLRLQPESGCCAVLIGGLTENTRRRRQQSVRVSLRDDADKVVILPQEARTRDFCDERGGLCFLLSIKIEKNALREYAFTLPGPLLDWMSPGQRVSLRVDRLEDDGTVSATGRLALMTGPEGKLAPYAEEAFIDCVLAARGFGELVGFIRSQGGALSGAGAGRVLDRLAELAGDDLGGGPDFELYRLYGDEAFPLRDEAQAGQWLYKAAQKHYPEAVRALRETPSAYAPPAEAIGSLDVCIASAEGGNRDAQFQLYEHYADASQPDHDLRAARQWLERAAENGHDEAVTLLEASFLESHMVDAQTDRFLALLEKAAAAGSANAHLLLFEAFHSGECLRRPCHRDKRLALECLQSAAQAGNVDACYRMWQLFEDGNDLLIDEKDAVAMLRRASDSGSGEAMNDLGELFVTGRIVSKDNDKGVSLIRESARLGCFGAQMRVYRMLREGRYYDVLLEADEKKAYEQLLAYADGGNPQAQALLWELYTDRNPVMLTRLEALGYLRRAAEALYTPAMYRLAVAEVDGVYRDADTEAGFQLLKAAAKRGEGDAQLALFRLYYTGRFCALEREINKERAYKWLSRAAAHNRQALYEMWELYCAGNEMELEPADALDMLFSAAGQGCCDALYTVAELFARGEFVAADAERAIENLRRAAALGHAQSMHRLYEVYASGRFDQQAVEPDAALAGRMLLLSAERGYAPACAEVCRLFEDGNPIGVDRTFAGECRTRSRTDGAPAARKETPARTGAAPAVREAAPPAPPAAER